MNKKIWQYEGINKEDYVNTAISYILNKGWTYNKFINELRISDITIPDHIKHAIQMRMA